MKFSSNMKYIVTALLLTGGLAACDPGPAETAGKKIDKAVDKAGDKINDAADKADEAISDEKK